jgi:hypothetical protein
MCAKVDTPRLKYVSMMSARILPVIRLASKCCCESASDDVSQHASWPELRMPYDFAVRLSAETCAGESICLLERRLNHGGEVVVLS